MEDFIVKINEHIAEHNLALENSGVNDEISITTTLETLLASLQYLKQNENIMADCLIGIFGTHFPNKIKQFKVQYLLLSIRKNLRIRVAVNITCDEKLPSIESIFTNSVWYEREVFDMFGVQFSDLSDRRRILTDYGVEYHPLLKDFPVTGFQETKYNPISQKVEYHPLQHTQEYRKFDTNDVISGAYQNFVQKK